MQNRYVADVGDFGKYGLLRFISSETGLKLGINWYLTEPTLTEKEKHKNDGKFISYLERDDKYSNKLKKCNEGLYYALKNIIIEWKKGKDTRNVEEIKNSKILGENVNFYEEEIKDGDERKDWWKEGFNRLSNSEIVFFDPDNGLIINGENNDKNKSPKYIYSDEVAPYFKRGQSVIIYQHANREKGGFENELNYKISELKKALNSNLIFTIRYKRGTARAFTIIPHDNHREKISPVVKSFMETDWGKEGHFTTVVNEEKNCI